MNGRDYENELIRQGKELDEELDMAAELDKIPITLREERIAVCIKVGNSVVRYKMGVRGVDVIQIVDTDIGEAVGIYYSTGRVDYYPLANLQRFTVCE